MTENKNENKSNQILLDRHLINAQLDTCGSPASKLTNRLRHFATICGALLVVLGCVFGAVFGQSLPTAGSDTQTPVMIADTVSDTPEITPAEESKRLSVHPDESILSLPLLAELESADTDETSVVPEISSLREYVRVGLKYSSTAVPSVTLTCPDGFLLASVEGRSWTESTDLRSYTSLYVVNENGKAAVYDTDGSTVLPSLGSTQCLMSACGDFDSRIISIDGVSYRDGFMALPSGEKLTVINFVDLEHYLWGVINSEMTYNNPTEALKAQAVAARSFAVSHYNYHSNYGFDLCTTSNCQSYKGVQNEKIQTTQACRDTSGVIMVADGKVAGGYYFASSGGYTLNSEDVWGGKLSYLRSVKDDYAPLNFWNKSITFDQLQARLSSGGKSVGTITSVEVTSRLSSGAATAVTITGTGGSVVLKNNEIPTVFGSSVLPSRFFSIGSYPEPGVEVEVIRTSEPYRYISGEEVKDIVVLKGANRELTIDTLDDRYLVTAQITVPVFSVGTLTSEYNKLTFRDEIVTGGTVYFTGLGNGHGVGFPQLSAIAMAKDGRTYDEILTYYYTGITLQTLDTI